MPNREISYMLMITISLAYLIITESLYLNLDMRRVYLIIEVFRTHMVSYIRNPHLKVDVHPLGHKVVEKFPLMTWTPGNTPTAILDKVDHPISKLKKVYHHPSQFYKYSILSGLKNLLNYSIFH